MVRDDINTLLGSPRNNSFSLESVVREICSFSESGIDVSGVVSVLEEMVGCDDWILQESALTILKRIVSGVDVSSSVPGLVALLSSDDWELLRSRAAEVIGDFVEAGVNISVATMEALLASLNDTYSEVREAASHALHKCVEYAPDVLLSSLENSLSDHDFPMRLAAAEFLWKLKKAKLPGAGEIIRRNQTNNAVVEAAKTESADILCEFPGLYREIYDAVEEVMVASSSTLWDEKRILSYLTLGELIENSSSNDETPSSEPQKPISPGR